MQGNKKYQWHKVADDIAALNFLPNGMTELLVGNKTICIALVNNTVFACA